MFFLMSSLVMLVAAPFANSIIFFNAMAQGYNDEDGLYNNYDSDRKDSIKNKLYECRTGPFKGFVVSSVEFCKRPPLVDSNRANPITVNATNFYTVVGNTAGGVLNTPPIGGGPIFVSPPLATVSSIATCDAGDFVLGVSFVVTGNSIILNNNTEGQPPFAVNIIKSSQPLYTQNGWNATALVIGFGGTVTADAVCFDNPPLRP